MSCPTCWRTSVAIHVRFTVKNVKKIMRQLDQASKKKRRFKGGLRKAIRAVRGIVYFAPSGR